MVFTNLDTIVRRWLLESGRPIHYYAEGLYHAATCLRELTFDTLQIVNTKQIPVNGYLAADLPSDFVTEVMVGVPVGSAIRPLSKGVNMNPLRLFDTETNEYTTYDTTNQTTVASPEVLPPVTWYWNFNEYGEPLGKFYGINGANKTGLYSIVRGRRQIQLNEGFAGDAIILMYISDGQSIDAATQIDPQAFFTIQNFIEWKRSPNASRHQSPEANTYHNERRLLRARLNDLTLDDIRNIIRRNFHAGIKN